MFIIILALPATVRAAYYEANILPWSGWWWPFIQGDLVTGKTYRGHPAPLEKYDTVVHGVSYGPATQYGYENYYLPNALTWEGMCFSWSAASILEEEPDHKGIYGDVTFYVGDKKGILTALYDNSAYDAYDIDSPEDFERILEEFIREQKMPIVMNLGSSEEKWNYPIYGYSITYRNTDWPTVHFTVTLSYASDQVSPDYVGTMTWEKTYYYYYRMNDRKEIVESGWENGSEDEPPKRAFNPYGTNTLNPGLDLGMAREIAAADDDSYEENDTFDDAKELPSGKYLLVAADDDYFKVHLLAGDKLDVRLENSESSEGSISLQAYDSAREPFLESVTDEGEINIEALQEGDYFLGVLPEKPGKECFYILTVEQYLAHKAVYASDPRTPWETRLHLLAPDGEPGRVIILQRDQEGEILASYGETLTGRSMEKTLDDLGFKSSVEGYLEVRSDSPVQGTVISSQSSGLWQGGRFTRTENAGAAVFMPHVAVTTEWKTVFGMVNTGENDEEVELLFYDIAGNLTGSDLIDLLPGEKVEDRRFAGISAPKGKSIVLSVVSGRPSLMGYMKYTYADRSGNTAAAIVQHDARRGPELILPHVVSNSDWWTGVALMNAGEEQTILEGFAYDAEGNLLDSFSQTLQPRQMILQMVGQLFPKIPRERIASVRFISDNLQDLSGIVSYGSGDGKQATAMPLLVAGPSPAYLLCTDVEGAWTGVTLLNSGVSKGIMSLSGYDRTGGLLCRMDREFKANEKMVFYVKYLFPGVEGVRFFKVEAEGTLNGMYALGPGTGSGIVGLNFCYPGID